ncbi:MAG: hypothetical protein NT154_05125, partial [Verrucomicrobia bacterium]|nr:hypothetical protein [Verrucomicrobiota bacterium]
MKFLLNRPMIRGLAIALAISSLTSNARANVYATNLKLDGSTNNPSIVAGQDVSISYILNEPASAGVTIRILSGATAVRTLVLAPGNPGTSRGTNAVTWNGKDDLGADVAGGDYSFSITAASTGYSTWTPISSDTNAGNQVTRAWGIAVNQNTNSFYYGRVFVANAYPVAGDPLGFHKLNADGSPAEEGMLSDGGYVWNTGISSSYYESPFRVRVGADDRFYALDWSGDGVILSWDQQITTNSMLNVMRQDNNPGVDTFPGSFSGFFVSGTGTNRQVWMCDNYSSGWGIYRWNMQPDGTLAPNDTGTQVVAVGGDMANSCFDVAVDKSNRVYALCQPNDPTQYKYLRFPADTNIPLLTADWKADTTSEILDPWAIAVNPAATYAAAARSLSNSVLILDANTGASVATISSNGYSHHAVAWDNVGNVYCSFDMNDTQSIWQTWSPPGANQATTLGLETIHVQGSPAQGIVITSIVPSGTNLIIHFTGPASAPASAFVVLSGTLGNGITNIVTGAIITGSGGVFQAVVPADGVARYYRIQM